MHLRGVSMTNTPQLGFAVGNYVLSTLQQAPHLQSFWKWRTIKRNRPNSARRHLRLQGQPKTRKIGNPRTNVRRPQIPAGIAYTIWNKTMYLVFVLCAVKSSMYAACIAARMNVAWNVMMLDWNPYNCRIFFYWLLIARFLNLFMHFSLTPSFISIRFLFIITNRSCLAPTWNSAVSSSLMNARGRLKIREVWDVIHSWTIYFFPHLCQTSRRVTVSLAKSMKPRAVNKSSQ